MLFGIGGQGQRQRGRGRGSASRENRIEQKLRAKHSPIVAAAFVVAPFAHFSAGEEAEGVQPVRNSARRRPMVRGGNERTDRSRGTCSPIIHRDHNHLVLGRVDKHVERVYEASTDGISASINPNHDIELLLAIKCGNGGSNSDRQAVLGLRWRWGRGRRASSPLLLRPRPSTVVRVRPRGA